MHWFTELWKALKYLSLSNTVTSCELSALRINKTVQDDTNLVSGRFKQ